MRRDILDHLVMAGASGTAAVRAVRLSDGFETLVTPASDGGALAAAAREALRQDRSQIATVDLEDWFLHVFNPPVHLMIAGAVHIAQSLAKMASELGWRVTLIDPRTGWANASRFPGVELVAAWPDEAMAKLGLHRRAAVVTLTHDPKLDDPALIGALRSEAFYVGALGSKKTHAARRDRLLALGFGERDIARIHGPVGLDIGASSPSEIAVSILAQIVERLRRDT